MHWRFIPHIFYQESLWLYVNNSVSCFGKGCKIVYFHTLLHPVSQLFCILRSISKILATSKLFMIGVKVTYIQPLIRYFTLSLQFVVVWYVVNSHYIFNFSHHETFHDWRQGNLYSATDQVWWIPAGDYCYPTKCWSTIIPQNADQLLSHKMLIRKCNKGCKVQHQRFLQPSGSDDDLRECN